jgi:phosphoglycerate dehydrogenase-like enzyme
MPKHHLLYWYEERIPQGLQDLVLSLIPSDEFEVERITYLAPDEEKIKKLEWAEVVLFAPGRHLPDELLAHAKHVKLMQLWSSGFEKFNHQGAAKFGIPVSNNGGANAGSVAEHAILLMLAVYKWLPNSHWRTVTGNWTGNSHGMDMFMLNQKRLGIIGFGNIGRQVARKLKGFDMDMVYYDVVRAPEEVEQELGVRFLPMDELLKESDVITLHLHSNASTQNIIGEREIGLMKKSAVLINVSRAQLVSYDALLSALRDKRIHGAGMDVYLDEPTKGDDPLLQLPNVVATPHMAGSTYDVYFRAVGNGIENFRRVLRGEPAKWVVNDPQK